jgi:hypothetical protein
MMIDHDYIKLGVAALFLITNFLGASFAIKRLRARNAGASPRAMRLPRGHAGGSRS